MGKYEHAPYDYGDDFDEDGNYIGDQGNTAPVVPVQPVVQEEGGNWAKRYADLRSHSAKQEQELKARLADLEAKLNSGTSNGTPQLKTKEEVAAWMRKVPDVAAIIRTMISDELEGTRTELNQLKSKTAEDEKKTTMKTAQQKLAEIHSDFFTDIVHSKEFSDWLATKPQSKWDAMYVNETDWQEAADVVTLYKAETGYGKPSRKQNSRNGAQDVRGGSVPAVGNDGETWFSESQIENMSSKDWEKYGDAIEEAQRKGRIHYDITGGAR